MTVAAIIERDGHFLLVEERVDGKRVYNQPAGHLEDGESLLDAVVRETLEETARVFRPAAVTGIYRWRHPHRQVTYLRVAFAGEALAHRPDYTLDPDIEQAVWMDHNEIVQRQDELRSPLVLRCIDDYLAGAAYPLTLLADVE